ncbi:MAG: PepSY domain-containing protein [Nitrosomonadales bacterium]|nr:PepSY domain-containing protein [Nitrosomonadales bacterium]
MKKNLTTMLIASMFIASSAYAANPQFKGPLDVCVQSALAKYPGTVTSLRAELEDGKAQYELDITGNDGKFWEAECDAKTGKVTETEQEVAADDPAFTSKAKVTLDAALKTALAKYPGAVMKIEYEIEPEGVAYEFDIKTTSGKVLEVEVDAVTGKLGDPEEVVYQIGE